MIKAILIFNNHG
ncbi:TPA: AP-3 complex subunit sigma-1, partial [Bos taurus]